jgi:hypothetical protein
MHSVPHSDEAKRKIKAAVLRHYEDPVNRERLSRQALGKAAPNKGVPKSEAQKVKLKEAALRQYEDPAQRERVSRQMSGRVAPNKGTRCPEGCTCAKHEPRHAAVKRVHGQEIPWEMWEALLNARPDLCELCGKPQNTKRGVLDLDHDHDTGELRGWLCNQCNSAIGKLGDDVAGLRSALAYLDQPSLLRKLAASTESPGGPVE